ASAGFFVVIEGSRAASWCLNGRRRGIRPALPDRVPLGYVVRDQFYGVGAADFDLRSKAQIEKSAYPYCVPDESTEMQSRPRKSGNIASQNCDRERLAAFWRERERGAIMICGHGDEAV